MARTLPGTGQPVYVAHVWHDEDLRAEPAVKKITLGSTLARVTPAIPDPKPPWPPDSRPGRPELTATFVTAPDGLTYLWDGDPDDGLTYSYGLWDKKADAEADALARYTAETGLTWSGPIRET